MKSAGDFTVPQISCKFGDRAFSVAALQAWNRLPMELRQLRSTPLFKRKLKTFLFTVELQN